MAQRSHEVVLDQVSFVCVSISEWACLRVCAFTYMYIESCVSLVLGLSVNSDGRQSPGLQWFLLVSSGYPKGQYPVR